MNSRDPKRFAFTLIELLVIIAIISVLAAMVLPVLARAKERGRRITCLNNLRQLSVASKTYVDDFQGAYPPRSMNSSWPDRFYKNYGMNSKVLLCPTDDMLLSAPATFGSSHSNNVADASPRSYLMNGWNDYFAGQFETTDWVQLESRMLTSGACMKEAATVHPVDMILLGEKQHTLGDFYMDLLENGGMDFTGITEQGRHDNNSHNMGSANSRGSNYTMVDGSSRFIRLPQSVDPINLWANSDVSRQQYSVLY